MFSLLTNVCSGIYLATGMIRWKKKVGTSKTFFFYSQVKEGLAETQKTLKVGDVQDFSNFMSAVIDKKAFDRISGYIDHAKSSPNTKIVAGGTYDESVGYYVQPTVVETTSKDDRIFTV